MIDHGLEGRRVLVTGASRGIGNAAARAFAAAGCRLALAPARSPRPGPSPPSPCSRAISRPWPMFAAWSPRRRRALGGLDVLVNNAGHMRGADPARGHGRRGGRPGLRPERPLGRGRLPGGIARPGPGASGCIVNMSSISARSGGSSGLRPLQRSRPSSPPSPGRWRPSSPRTASGSTRWRQDHHDPLSRGLLLARELERTRQAIPLQPAGREPTTAPARSCTSPRPGSAATSPAR